MKEAAPIAEANVSSSGRACPKENVPMSTTRNTVTMFPAMVSQLAINTEPYLRKGEGEGEGEGFGDVRGVSVLKGRSSLGSPEGQCVTAEQNEEKQAYQDCHQQGLYDTNSTSSDQLLAVSVHKVRPIQNQTLMKHFSETSL